MRSLMFKSLPVMASLFVLGLGLCATKVEAASHSHLEFVEDHDLNRDGKVTLEEFRAVRRIEFLRADLNADGKLSEAEYIGAFEAVLMTRLSKVSDPDARKEDYQRQMRQAKVRFSVLDKNKDGFISWDEYLATGERMFGLHDKNKDGVVDAIDLDLIRKEIKSGKEDDFIYP